MAPIIAITTSRQRLALNHSSGQEVTFLSNAVINILVKLGCVPLLLPNAASAIDCAALLEKVDGIVLSSGQDISPGYYQQDAQVEYDVRFSGIGEPFRRPAILKPDLERDQLEIALYKAAIAKDLPVLGLCRGMQLINVAEGGSLWQELPDSGDIKHNLDADGWIHYHEIEVAEGTLLQRIVKTPRWNMSSVHHQGIAQLAPTLTVNARTRDGLIEGLERKGNSFVLGLQGHFERTLENQPENLMIWQAFVNYAAKPRA